MKNKKYKNKKKNTTNGEKNTNYDINNMEESDIKNIKLLMIQMLVIFTDLYAYSLLYTSSLQGIQYIYNKYNNIKSDPTEADKNVVRAISIFLELQFVSEFVAIERYNILYEQKQKGKISYSLKPNLYFIIANIFGIITNIYFLAGAVGIYERDRELNVFGVSEG